MSNIYDFIAKFKNGQLIRLLPNYRDDGSRGDNIIISESIFIKNEFLYEKNPNGKGKMFYDSLNNPILNIPLVRRHFSKYISKRYMSYGLVDNEYKLLTYGEVLYSQIKSNQTAFDINNKIALKIKLDNNKHIPNYNGSLFIDHRTDLYTDFLLNELYDDILPNEEKLKSFMLKRPLSIESMIESNSIINSVECFKFLSEVEEVRLLLTPLFRKNRISNLFEE